MTVIYVPMLLGARASLLGARIFFGRVAYMIHSFFQCGARFALPIGLVPATRGGHVCGFLFGC